MTDILTRLSLGQRFREFVEAYGSPERGEEFVGAFVESLPEAEYEFYLKQAMKRLTPVLDNDIRRHAASKVNGVLGEPAKATFPLTRAKQRHIPSTKQRLLREQYWPTFLCTSIPTEAGYKALGFATAADLRYNAQQRRSLASANLVEAERFERYAEIMEANHAEVLADLDLTVLEAVFSN